MLSGLFKFHSRVTASHYDNPVLTLKQLLLNCICCTPVVVVVVVYLQQKQRKISNDILAHGTDIYTNIIKR